jgi:hypothetical protein
MRKISFFSDHAAAKQQRGMNIMKRIVSGRIVVVMVIMAATAGCGKEDYTLPVDFQLQFSMAEKPIMNGAITIDYIHLYLKSIDIRGYRELGEDVFLTRKIDEEHRITIQTSAPKERMQFDIPQGIYNPLSFSFIFRPDEEESSLVDDIGSWLEDVEDVENDLADLQEDLGDIIENYLNDLQPCIIIKGKYSHNQLVRNLVIVINDPLNFQVISKNKNEEQIVALDKDIINRATLYLDPSYWFSVVTTEMLNGTFHGILDDAPYIFLNKYVNSQLYTTIFNRIEESTTLVINE